MSDTPKLISVIVTTYQWPEALRAVLSGLASQDDENFEVIVADDGSDNTTRDVIRDSSIKAKHVWQPHEGFRVSHARNRAILASSGDYLVFLDGDCVPREHFVSRHRRLAEHGFFVMGNRVMLKEKMTKRVLANNSSPEDWGFMTWLGVRAIKGCNRIAPMITLPLGSLRKRVKQTWKASIGANFAVWRSDMAAIDGFDTAFVGWGYEDNDVLVRLLRAGVKRKTGRFSTGVIHLWHEAAYTRENRCLFNETCASDRLTARIGLSRTEHIQVAE